MFTFVALYVTSCPQIQPPTTCRTGQPNQPKWFQSGAHMVLSVTKRISNGTHNGLETTAIFYFEGPQIYPRAQTNVLVVVETKPDEDLSQLGFLYGLYLVHPWIDFLLDRQPVRSVPKTIAEENADDNVSVLSELPSLPWPIRYRVNDQANTNNMAHISRRTAI